MTEFTPRADLLDQARSLVIDRQEASKSLLQRHLSIGFRQACDLLARLETARVVTPVTFSGIRLVAAEHRRAPAEREAPKQRHVRMLRDLAIYLVESREEGSDGHSEFLKELLAVSAPKLREDWQVVRRAAFPVISDGFERPVTAVAKALACIPAMDALFRAAEIQSDLEGACDSIEDPAAGPLDGAERQRRSFLRIARYLEMRNLAGREPNTNVLDWLPACVPTGRSVRREQDTGAGVHREHVVPRRLVARRARDLLRSGVPVGQVAQWVEPFNCVVEITHAEAHYLDNVRGWRECMPPGWQFDRDSIFARLIQAEVPFTMSDAVPSRDPSLLS